MPNIPKNKYDDKNANYQDVAHRNTPDLPDSINHSRHASITSTEQLYQAPTSSLSQEHLAQTAPNNKTWYHFSGRIGRLRYLSYQLFIGLLFYLIIIVFLFLLGWSPTNIQSNNASTSPTIILAFVVIIPAYIVSIIYGTIIYPKRRLNDLGQSGWLALIILIPLVNFIYLLYLMFARGNEGVNQYGAPPRENSVIHYIGGLIGPIFFLIFVLGIVAAIAIPAYQDYLQRSHEITSQQAP